MVFTYVTRQLYLNYFYILVYYIILFIDVLVLFIVLELWSRWVSGWALVRIESHFLTELGTIRLYILTCSIIVSIIVKRREIFLNWFTWFFFSFQTTVIETNYCHVCRFYSEYIKNTMRSIVLSVYYNKIDANGLKCSFFIVY